MTFFTPCGGFQTNACRGHLMRRGASPRARELFSFFTEAKPTGTYVAEPFLARAHARGRPQLPG
jgi:hypothetical protein